MSGVLLDVGDFVLLLLVRLHLVHLVFLLRPDVDRVITTIVHQLLLHRQVHDVRADGIHEILRMTRQDQDMVVRAQVRREPNDSSQIQVVRRLVEELCNQATALCSEE